MIRNLKVLGTAVVAVFALTAMVASPASADFRSEQAHTTISGAQEGTHTFTTDVGTIHCAGATFAGTTTEATSSQVTITPTYTGCNLTSIFGNIGVNVNMNGCDYLFTTTGEVHIVCPTGANITVVGPGCTVTVHGGKTYGGNTFTNVGAGSTREILVHTAITEITYAYSGFTCGSGSGTTNGTYNGTTTMTGADTNNAHVGIWHESGTW